MTSGVLQQAQNAWKAGCILNHKAWAQWGAGTVRNGVAVLRDAVCFELQLDSESLGSSDTMEPLPISMPLHAQLYLQIQEAENDWNWIARPMLRILPGLVVHDSGAWAFCKAGAGGWPKPSFNILKLCPSSEKKKIQTDSSWFCRQRISKTQCD